MAVRIATLEEDEGPAEERVLVKTDWKGYVRRRARLSSGHRLTYCRGWLEIMTTSLEHERAAHIIEMLIEAFLVYHRRPYVCGLRTTFRRREIEMGFEPDSCYWLDAESHSVLGVKRWNPRRQPPPRVAVEVSITNPLVDRLPVFAGLGVREIWWFHDGRLEVLLLQPGGTYRTSSMSAAFPDLPAAVVLRYIHLGDTMTDMDIQVSFLDWLKTR